MAVLIAVLLKICVVHATVASVTDVQSLTSALADSAITSVLLDAGTYSLTGPLTINRDLVFRAAGAVQSVVLSNTGGRVLVVQVDINVELHGLVLRDGRGGNDLSNDGGCIHNSGNLKMYDSLVTACESAMGGCCGRNGGGIANAATGVLELFSTTVTSNTASGNGGPIGGGIYNAATAPVGLTDSTVTGNSAYRNIDISGTSEIRYYPPSTPPSSPPPQQPSPFTPPSSPPQQPPPPNTAQVRRQPNSAQHLSPASPYDVAPSRSIHE